MLLYIIRGQLVDQQTASESLCFPRLRAMYQRSQEAILVFQGCRSKAPQTELLQQQCFLTFLETRSSTAACHRATLPLKALRMNPSLLLSHPSGFWNSSRSQACSLISLSLCLCVHLASSPLCVPVCPLISSEGHQSLDPVWPHLHSWPCKDPISK